MEETRRDGCRSRLLGLGERGERHGLAHEAHRGAQPFPQDSLSRAGLDGQRDQRSGTRYSLRGITPVCWGSLKPSRRASPGRGLRSSARLSDVRGRRWSGTGLGLVAQPACHARGLDSASSATRGRLLRHRDRAPAMRRSPPGGARAHRRAAERGAPRPHAPHAQLLSTRRSWCTLRWRRGASDSGLELPRLPRRRGRPRESSVSPSDGRCGAVSRLWRLDASSVREGPIVSPDEMHCEALVDALWKWRVWSRRGRRPRSALAPSGA